VKKINLYMLLLLLALTAATQANSTNSLLLESLRNNNRAEINELLIKGADVNVTETDGTTLMHWAAHWDDMETAERLIQAGADVNKANEYGVTPLWLACTNKSTGMVKRLLDGGANPDPVLWTGETALMNCARTGATGAVTILLETDEINVHAKENKKGQNALMWAAAGGHAQIVQLLIENGADINGVSHAGFTPLLFAARSGDIETSRLLIDAGADPDNATPEHGNTLVIASAGGHEDLALHLLKMGANPDSADRYGITPLHYAIRSGMAALNGVRYDSVYRVRPVNMDGLASGLLEAGADVNARIQANNRLGPDGSPFNMSGATPYFLATVSADVALMQVLREYGADPKLAADGGITPLIAAARSACTGSCVFVGGGNNASEQDIELAYQAVKAVVEAGVDVNTADENGLTAMHMAAYTGADKVVKYLAEQGAIVNVRSKFGETPWSMASGISPVISFRGLYGDHKTTVSLLEQLGAKRTTREEMNPDAPAPPGQ